MKAYVLHRPGDGCIEERPTPRIRPNEVLLKVQACGVCGSESDYFDGGEPAAPNVILGHEYAGTVVEAGSEVKNFGKGDRVAVDPNVYCGSCDWCNVGRTNLCKHLKALGVDIDGGFAPYSAVPELVLHRVPDEMSIEHAAMVEPLACALHMMDRLRIEQGQSVLIIGGGTIGLMMLQLARLKGAYPVILSEPQAYRRDVGIKLGADYVIDPAREGVAKRVQEICRGVDVAIECVGKVELQQEAVGTVRRGGTVGIMGCAPQGARELLSLDTFRFQVDELSLVSSILNPMTHSRALTLIAGGRVDVAPLITNRIDLDELPPYVSGEKGKRDPGVIKTVLTGFE